ncbi:hypothetical protein HMPREF1063_01645 [Phocaeicola dorei CL02T00C15]|uniref:Uncharacterized protein n=1 Tax=Phocaeicola dorei CL02T12C06 TaxID=997876 RepID=I8W6U8_9BACT|nr:hypothetical protein HMPREF1063_01645 [Phocaeicola dorei CL02T00C15]EIY33512.1 hypothetical protein HMPREF1064_02542 [Phocaeicola dorei CL02T12C06]
MKIAIEAQRIFRKEKHGMDYVASGNHPGTAKDRQTKRILHTGQPGG